MTYVKINDIKYEATVKSFPMDTTWDNRLAKLITPLDPTVVNLFHDDVQWFYVEEHEEIDPEDPEKTITVESEIDMSEYNVLGDVVKHNTGVATVKMGKTTELEEAYELLYGGIDNE